jgi:cardiolipin synthase (CMP-forming)
MKSYLTIPNILTFYRFLAFPFILYMALTGQERLFAILLIINLITDILDGALARLLKQQTEFGARMDSIADTGTYILGFLGIYLFKQTDFAGHWLSFSMFLGLFVLCNVFSQIKFKRMPSLHLYSWKLGGYIQGAFFFTLFGFGFNTPFYYFMVTWGILAFIEHLIIQLLLPEMRSNQKGLYWVLKARQK